MQTSKRKFVVPLMRNFGANVVYYSVAVSLASMSAAFPIYVHFHREDFGPPEMRFYGASSLQEVLDTDSPSFRGKIAAQIKPRLELDKIMTGSIRSSVDTTTQPVPGSPQRQPYPDVESVPSSAPLVLYVGKGRVLAFDGGRMVSLRRGSQLANGTQVTDILRNGDKWIVKISSGDELDWPEHP